MEHSRAVKVVGASGRIFFPRWFRSWSNLWAYDARVHVKRAGLPQCSFTALDAAP